MMSVRSILICKRRFWGEEVVACSQTNVRRSSDILFSGGSSVSPSDDGNFGEEQWERGGVEGNWERVGRW